MIDGKDLNLNIGGGENALLAALLSKNGNEVGGNGMWPIIIMLLVLMSRGGGLFGGEASACAAKGVANENALLNMFTSFGGIEKSICSATSILQQGIGATEASIIASNNLQSQFMNSGFSKVQADLAEVRTSIGNNALNTANDICKLGSSLNSNMSNGFNMLQNSLFQSTTNLSKEVSCGFNTQNTNLLNGFNNTANLMNQNFNATTAQMSQLANAIDKLSCLTNNGFERVTSTSNLNAERILCSIKETAQEQTIAKLQADLCRAKEEAANATSSININSIGSRISADILNSLRSSGNNKL